MTTHLKWKNHIFGMLDSRRSILKVHSDHQNWSRCLVQQNITMFDDPILALFHSPFEAPELQRFVRVVGMSLFVSGLPVDWRTRCGDVMLPT